LACLEHIINIRAKKIDVLLLIVRQHFDGLRDEKPDGEPGKFCLMHRIGFMITELYKIPCIPNTSKVDDFDGFSLQELVSKIHKVVYSSCAYAEAGSMTWCGRETCTGENKNFCSFIDRIMGDSYELPGNISRHIRAQAEK
jgi:hypothetical protein